MFVKAKLLLLFTVLLYFGLEECSGRLHSDSKILKEVDSFNNEVDKDTFRKGLKNREETNNKDESKNYDTEKTQKQNQNNELDHDGSMQMDTPHVLHSTDDFPRPLDFHRRLGSDATVNPRPECVYQPEITSVRCTEDHFRLFDVAVPLGERKYISSIGRASTTETGGYCGYRYNGEQYWIDFSWEIGYDYNFVRVDRIASDINTYIARFQCYNSAASAYESIEMFNFKQELYEFFKNGRCDENSINGIVQIHDETSKCLTIDWANGWQIGGMQASTKFTTCESKKVEQQYFLLSGPGYFYLVPIQAANLDVPLLTCIGRFGDTVSTSHCIHIDTKLTMKNNANIRNSEDKCIRSAPEGLFNCDEGNTMKIVPLEQLLITIDGNESKLLSPKSFKSDLDGYGYYLIGNGGDCGKFKISLHSMVSVKMDMPNNGYDIIDGSILEFKFKLHEDDDLSTRLCILMNTGTKCFILDGDATGGDIKVPHYKEESNARFFRIPLSDYKGKLNGIGFMQGDVEYDKETSMKQVSEFLGFNMASVIDPLRYNGCFNIPSSTSVTSRGINFDACHKLCYENGATHFLRDGDQNCRCLNSALWNEEANDCTCSSTSDIGNNGCAYSVKVPNSYGPVKFIMNIDGEDTAPLSRIEGENTSKSYVGLAQNDGDNQHAIILYDHEKVTFDFINPLRATSGNLIEFEFTLEELPANLVAICMVRLEQDDKCYFLRDRNRSDESLRKNTDGLIASDDSEPGIFRIQFEYIESEEVFTGISFKQESNDSLRLGKSKFDKVRYYKLKEAIVTLNHLGKVEITVKDVDVGVNHFQPEVLLQIPSGEYERVPSAEKKIFKKDEIKFTDLIPGRRYMVTLKPVTSTGEPVDAKLQNNLARLVFVTSCACDPFRTFNNQEDNTGRPKDVTITQKDGTISIDFIDSSVCETAYTFTRREIIDGKDGIEDSFAPNYFFYSTDECVEHISPGDGFQDNIRRSGLLVGNSYKYCARAVSETYMVDTAVDNGKFRVSSNEECNIHTINWEASAIVKVTLKKESGSIPVEKADVTWELMDPEGMTILKSDNQITGVDGTVRIKLKLDPSNKLDPNKDLSYFNDFGLFPLKIKVKKETGSETHKFLCNDESSDCTEEGTTIYLKHLSFDEPVHFVDATSVPLKGKVYIGSEDGTGNIVNTQCPLHRAKVCLYRKDPRSPLSDVQDACDYTDTSGFYTLPATLGLRVYPQVSYKEHVFKPVKEEQYQTGILVTAEEETSGHYDNHDFWDTNMTSLIVEVAGGECDKRLGNSKINVRLDGCDKYNMDFDQQYVRGAHIVPAHTVLVGLKTLVDKNPNDRDFVMESLKNENRKLDLTEVDAFNGTEVDDNETAGFESEETIQMRTARFQYNGTLRIIPKIDNETSTTSCLTTVEIKTTDGSYKSESKFHRVESGEEFDLTVGVRQLIIPEQENVNEDIFCDIFESTDVTILNKVGLDADDEEDTKILEIIRQQGDPAELSQYTACTGSTGCTLPVEYPVGDDTTWPRVQLKLRAGIPNVQDPHTKKITIQSGNIQHVMEVVIEGQKGLGGSSFPLPTHFPLLVLRDPPGGLSSATYSNIKTTVKITMENYERYDGIDGGAKSLLTAAPKATSCAGPGVFLVCNDLFESNVYGGFYTEGETKWLTEFNDDTYSHGFTVTWSYTTAGDTGQGDAGKNSDAFLVPSISILFRETSTVTFSDESCEPTVSISTKFDLTSAENKRTLSFLTYRQLTLEVLPRMKNQLNYLKNDANPEAKTIQQNIDVLETSISAWNLMIEEYEKTNELVKTDTSKLYKVGEISDQQYNAMSDPRPRCQYQLWMREPDPINLFTYKCTPDAVPRIMEWCHRFEETQYPHGCGYSSKGWKLKEDWTDLPKDHEYWGLWDFQHPKANDASSPLAPQTLIDGAEEFPSIEKYLNNAQKDTSLGAINRIHFGGGGETIAMSFDTVKLDTTTRKFDHRLNINKDTYSAGGAEAQTGIKLGGVGLLVSGNVGYVGETSGRQFISDEKEEVTSVSVEFGDPDAGDEFLVDVYVDPKYGTLIFHTVEGQSSCPHEDNTERIEKPDLTVEDHDREDETITFELKLANEGRGNSSFYLFTDVQDNPDGLQMTVNGESLAGPSTWYLDGTYLGGSSLTANVRIDRGPSMYEYSSIPIYLQSVCEYEGGYGDAKAAAILQNSKIEEKIKKIQFLEPCVKVQWAGDLDNERTFVINENNMQPDGDYILQVEIRNLSPDNLADTTRLESVILEYRRIIDTSTRVSDTFPSWKLAVLKEGTTLDFKDGIETNNVITVDWKVPSSDDGTYEVRIKSKCHNDQYYTSETLVGLVDLKPPEIFGLPTPSVNLYPGEELVVSFTEDLWCEMPYTFDILLQVSEFENSFDSDYMDKICSGNKIILQFKEKEIPGATYSRLLGRDYTLTISNVQDLAKNTLDTYTYSSNFICLPPVPKLEINHKDLPDRMYLPHEPIVFTAIFTNDRKQEERATSFMELGVDLVTNAANFEVLVNGESLALTQQYTIDGNETVTTNIEIRKGSGKGLLFSPITIFLRSSCDEDSHDPVEVTAQLWNWEDGDGNKFIKFTSPCPAIRWAGEMNQFPQFVLNNDTLTTQESLLEVSIFNERYTERKLFDRSTYNTNVPSHEARLQDVVLLYRRIGDWSASAWTEGELVASGRTSEMDGRAVDFSMENIEDNFGYATLYWDLSSVVDSTYLVRVESRCKSILNAHTELAKYTTNTVQVVIDRSSPEVYGIPDLELPKEMHPSREFVIPFTENIYCDEPYTFDLQLILEQESGITTTLQDRNGIHVKCEGQNIKYRFDSEIFTGDAYSSLFDSRIQINLKNVEDIARNQISSEYNVSYNNFDKDYTRSELFKGMGCDNTDNDGDFLIDECDEDLTAPTISIPDAIKWKTIKPTSESPNVFKVQTETTVQIDLFQINVMKDICFNTTDRAKDFLLANIAVSDDCSEVVNLTVDFIPDMSTSDRATYLATATDKRCEGSEGNHVRQELFQTMIFDGYDPQLDIKQQGCNGIDENCDGVVDDCSEDRDPPTIYVSEAVILAELPQYEGMLFVTSHCFDTTDKVADFLEQNIYAEDDCAQSIDITINEVGVYSDQWKKNHKYNLTEYLVIATDQRCGPGPYWSSSKTILVEVFDQYDEDVKQQGCNGIDDNCDGIVDDCSEDRSPPIISINELVVVSVYDNDENATLIKEPTFKTVDEGRDFLFKNIKVVDDCANDLLLDVSRPNASCDETRFTVTVTDPRCSEINPIQTVSKDYILRIDGEVPTINVGFDNPGDVYYNSDDEILHISQSDIPYENVLFWYTVQDNCPQTSNVEVTVTSNEFVYNVEARRKNPIALLTERNDLDQSHTIQLFVEPSMCIVNDPKYFCELSSSSVDQQFRLYEITVTVTDYAGNIGTKSCIVIVVPDISEEKNKNKQLPKDYYINLLSESKQRHVIDTLKTQYEVVIVSS